MGLLIVCCPVRAEGCAYGNTFFYLYLGLYISWWYGIGEDVYEHHINMDSNESGNQDSSTRRYLSMYDIHRSACFNLHDMLSHRDLKRARVLFVKLLWHVPHRWWEIGIMKSSDGLGTSASPFQWNQSRKWSLETSYRFVLQLYGSGLGMSQSHTALVCDLCDLFIGAALLPLSLIRRISWPPLNRYTLCPVSRCKLSYDPVVASSERSSNCLVWDIATIYGYVHKCS